MRALLLALALAGTAAPAAAFDVQRALSVSQAAIGRTVGDHVLVRSDGTRLRLSELAGRPLLVSLVYTGCYQVCPTTTRQLLRVTRIARATLGAGRFRVLVVGFDTAQDTPDAMRVYARRQGAAGEPDWIFASADEATVRALARELGFVYERAPQGFDHLLQVSLLDGRLRVRRQLYGDALTAPQLVEPLKEIIYGEPAGRGLVAEIADRVRLFCTTYDPATGAYRFDYSLFIGLAIATLILLSTLAFLVRELRRRGAS